MQAIEAGGRPSTAVGAHVAKAIDDKHVAVAKIGQPDKSAATTHEYVTSDHSRALPSHAARCSIEDFAASRLLQYNNLIF